LRISGGWAHGKRRHLLRVRFPLQATGNDTGADADADAVYREQNATIIRNDEATNLPANARVLYLGNFYFESSNDPAYKTITAAASPSGEHQGAGFDPLNRPGDWSSNAAFSDIMTQ